MTDNIQSEEGISEKETMAKGACATNTSTSLRKIPDYKRRMIHTAVFYYGYFVFVSIILSWMCCVLYICR